MTQFVACRFRPSDTRLYTFANDGEPVKEGDFVEAMSRGLPKTVEVASVSSEAPPFACAPVLRKVEKPESWRANKSLATSAQRRNHNARFKEGMTWPTK